MSTKEKKYYWRKSRVISLLAWLVLFVSIVPLLETIGWIPEGNSFIFRCALLPTLLVVLTEQIAFRISTFVIVIFAIFSLNSFQPLPLTQFIEGLNYRIRDVWFELRGFKPTSGQIVIVDLDEKSLAEVGQWPWPRSLIAEMVETLQKDGAKVIGFDMVFSEKDRLSLKDWVAITQDTGIVKQANLDPHNSTLSWHIPAETVKNLICNAWIARWKNLPNFTIDSNWNALELESYLTQFYLDQKKIEWEAEQADLAGQAYVNGKNYHKLPFSSPISPLLNMGREAHELFYLHCDWTTDKPLKEGADVVFDNDLALGAAFTDNVVAGAFLTFDSINNSSSSLFVGPKVYEQGGIVLASEIQNVDDIFPALRIADKQIINIPILQQNIKRQGLFNIIPDSAGTARYYTLMLKAPIYSETMILKEGKEDSTGGELLNPDNYTTKIIPQIFTYPTLALEMFRVGNRYTKSEATIINGKKGILLQREDLKEKDRKQGLNQRFIPVDIKGDIHLNYFNSGVAWGPTSEYGSEYYYKYVSLADVIARRFEPGIFKDKYVLIGSTSATFHDLIDSPYNSTHPGLAVHANMLDNFISEDYIVDDLDYNVLYSFLGVLLGGLICAVLVSYTNPLIGAAFGCTVLTLLPIYSYYQMVYNHQIFDFVYIWISCLVIMIFVIIVNFFLVGRESRFLAQQFASMVSGELLEKLKNDPNSVSLEGQKAMISVMFSDVAGFTTISEKLSPQLLVKVLNDYLTPMTHIILKYDGFIDKFIGDAIMACWGIPYPDENHAVKACYACLDQQKALVNIAQKIKDDHGIDIYVRMGVSSGEVSAALMGSDQRKSYTVMGDVVNLGARLEPACKDYGILILISEKTYMAARDKIEARCIDKIVVKGKTEAIPVYELMGKKGELSTDQLRKKDLFDAALELHWQRDWDSSLDKLKEIVTIDPTDGPTLNLIERVEHYKIEPPSADWQGEIVKKTK
ncbi:MAG: adenylate cyclase [Chlamydiales bacterium]|jgi:class 3 adenylate cyclase/CHASE2 domain-containing sensor protein|nr:adenylate cyclase [Chlamydiales bacterium]